MSKIDVANPTSSLEALVDADLDTLAPALYVTTDDLLKESPQLAPYRPERASRSAVWWFAVGCLEWCLFVDAIVWWFCVAGGRDHAAAGALAWVGMRI